MIVAILCLIAFSADAKTVHSFSSLNAQPTIEEIASLQLPERKELMCLALTVYHEARGSIQEDMFGVAQVAMNRTRDDRLPKTICKVIWQRGQFAWTMNKSLLRTKLEIECWRRSQMIAYLVYSDSSLIDHTDGAVGFQRYSSKAKIPKDAIRIGAHRYINF